MQRHRLVQPAKVWVVKRIGCPLAQQQQHYLICYRVNTRDTGLEPFSGKLAIIQVVWYFGAQSKRHWECQAGVKTGLVEDLICSGL